MSSRDSNGLTRVGGQAPDESSLVALQVHSLSKSFGANRALIDVDLDVRFGEIHAVVGQNGSGKSTIVKILGGYHTPDAGSASVGGRPFMLGSAIAAEAAGLRFVHQDLGLIESMTVAENFYLDSAPGRWVRRLSRKSERLRAGEALEEFGYAIDPDRVVSALTAAEKTAVAVVRASSGEVDEPQLLILDEPTASLPGADAEIMFRALRGLAARGKAVLFISHHLDEVLGLSDRVTVIRDGRNVTTRAAETLSNSDLAGLMLGRALANEATKHGSAVSAGLSRPIVLQVSTLRTSAVHGIDFEIRSGEVLGVAGLTGSGREQVAPAVAGQIDRMGTMTVSGVRVRSGGPRAAIAAGVQYLPAERRRDGLFLDASVRENVLISGLKSVSRFGRLVRRRERAEAERWIRDLGVRPAHAEKLVSELSGGNQQKVVIGRLLRRSPAVLVLDEPTQGVDIGAKLGIHRLVARAAADGAAVLVCSSDETELAAIADRVLVLRKGLVGAALEGAAITAEHVEEAQLSASSPDPTIRQKVDQ